MICVSVPFQTGDESNPSAAVEDILVTPDKLGDLDLDAFAEELERQVCVCVCVCGFVGMYSVCGCLGVWVGGGGVRTCEHFF